MMSKKAIAATVIATSLLFSGGVISPSETTVSAATKVSSYQTELNTFAAHYAKILRTVESYNVKLDKAKSEQEAIRIYDEYLAYFEKALDNVAPVNGLNADIQKMDVHIYDSLVEMYNLELDTIDYLNGDMTKANYDKAVVAATKFIDEQEALFKKAANTYKTKHRVTFSRDMLYLLDQEPAQGKTYTVKKGDTLYRIAKNNKTTVATLKKLNNLKSDSLKIGQVLKLPGAPVSTPSTYKVQKGDTLYSISKKVKVSVADLKKINNLKSDRIHPGQILKLKK
ncbi:LysM peptidoglycan-binding domain-containing protein [Bacillus sp. V59.32b]|uniref:LysM peptidoglycan-binding domain-containing protein n=1 Tax=Bacillus sp. V59.32b TaxID=1758642 RepID=UPI0013589F85|nr:LysM peptidoglycan-binding domain-containing protein [Bacillus sp. V59.32b]